MSRHTNGKKRPITKDEVAATPWGAERRENLGGKLRPDRLQTTDFVARTTAQLQAKATLASHSLVFLIGPAGTAKTTLAAAQAVEDLKMRRAKRLVLARACVDAADPIGAFPGTAREKLELWYRAMLDALILFLGKEQVKTMLDQELIELMPLGLIRGQSISNATVMVDEIQNMTPKQAKMMLTRIGENCRMIMTCDPDQCDLADHVVSACEDLARFEGAPDIAFVDFSTEDVTRSVVCRTVLQCYAGVPKAL